MTALSCLVLSSFTSCSKDIILDDTEALQATKLTATTSQSVTLTPIQDAYLKGNTRYNTSILGVSENLRDSYLMFDLSKVDGEITSATLEFTVSAHAGSGTTKVFTGTNSTWTENSLSPQNRPQAYRFIGKINKSYNIGDTEKISLNPEYFTNGKISLVLWHSDGQGYTFASKESATPPKLVISYSSTGSTTQKAPDVPKGYIVTVNGKSTNNGLSESSAWSLEHAFNVSKPGDIIYVKAGNYGNKKLQMNKKSGSGLIKIIGYVNTPGDIQSSNGPTHDYGNTISANNMPLLQSNPSYRSTAIKLFQSNVLIENFQITGYEKGLLTQSFANNVTAKNLIIKDMGSQTSNAYNGWGIDIRGKNSVVENCYVQNASAVAIQLIDSDYSKIKNSKVYANNTTNPTDYYYLLTGGTDNALVENCYAERARGLSHGGHGFNIKNDGAYNTFRNCVAKRTNFELTYSGVHHNTIDGGGLYGVNTSSAEWATTFSIIGGSHDNIIKNLSINDTHSAITLNTYNDKRGADASLGHNNTFENVTVNNTRTVLLAGGGTNYNSTAKNYTFSNCKFSNFQAVARTYYRTDNIVFRNSTFQNGDHLVYEAGAQYRSYSKFNVSWQSCSWSSMAFRTP